MLKDLIARNREGFRSLCEAHEVASLHAFGSSVQGGFKETSDVDLVVDLKTKDPLRFGELMLDLWDKLETFFGRKVDLLTLRSVKNPVMREEIERTKVLVYDGSQAQVLVRYPHRPGCHRPSFEGCGLLRALRGITHGEGCR